MVFIIPSASENIAFNIALGVLLLSVVLHPIVRYCFYRIRAERAWKLIERRESVEVTKYSFFSEALGDRGRWDTARIVTLMIAVFHVSTWGLELTLDIAIRKDGPVDLLNRPPPVYSRFDGDNLAEADWIVRKYPDPVPDSGSLNAVHGTLVDGNATTTYRVDGNIVDGNTLFASWSSESAQVSSGLFYDIYDGQATVDAIACTTTSKEGDVYLEDDATSWGTVEECESGPKVTDARFDDISSPPTILLSSAEGDVYLIVEEESSYPSFLYSVWMPGESSTDSDSKELHHEFYISSTTRLVEAVVTGIVNGHIDGGSCVDLMSQYSLENDDYHLNGSVRISPFGEHPNSSYVERLDQVEPIVQGVEVGTIGTVCGSLLIAVTAAALLGCMFFHSGKSLDVYNRDELIRAVSLPGGQGADGSPAALKISVRQESDKAFSIIISDDGVYRGCDGFRKKLSCHRDASSSISSTSRSISRSSSIPVGPRELTFDGVRHTVDDVRPALGGGGGKAIVRNGGTPTRIVRTVELIASPVPSPVDVVENAVPRDTVRAAFHRTPSRRKLVRRESKTQILDDIEALPPNTSLVELRSGGTWEDARSVQLTARQAIPRVEMDVEEEAPKE